MTRSTCDVAVCCSSDPDSPRALLLGLEKAYVLYRDHRLHGEK